MEIDINKLESFILEKISKSGLPGLSIAIIHDNEVIYSRGFGFRDVENGYPATKNTIYGIGSVTKSFTALAIMQLAEKGLVSVDDPISKYIPTNLLPLDKAIKIWHLLTHSSGIPALGYAEAFIRGIIGDSSTWFPIASYNDIFTFMSDADKWVETEPGKEFFYLNEGYVLLGYIIEKISGVTYEEFIKKHILDPLKMNRSYFKREDVERDEDKAVPYIITNKGERIPSVYPYGLNPDGGLISNVLDLSNYIKLYINRGKFNGAKIISEESIIEMERERIKIPFGVFDEEFYGYGWRIIPNFLGKKLICHSGSVLVSTAYVGYIPNEKIGVAILANGSGYPPSFIGMYALALALGKDPEKTLSFIQYDRLLEKYVGTYENYKGTFKAEIVRKGDFLQLNIKGKYTETSLPLIYKEHDDKTAYFYSISAGRKIEVIFREKDGTIEMIYERYKMKKI